MLRVATYNLYLGADLTLVFGVDSAEQMARQTAAVHRQLLGTDFPARAEAIAAILVRERVDVAGLQEVAQWRREGAGSGETVVWLDFLEELLGALERAGRRYTVHARTANFRGSAQVEGDRVSVMGHNVVLVGEGSGVRVVGEDTGDFTRTLDVESGLSHLVFNVARSWGWVDLEVGGRTLRFCNTHTEAWDEDVRNTQRDELLAALGEPGFPVVVVGDFNAQPEKVGMPPEYVDAWLAAGEGDGYTCGQAADLSNAESALCERIDYVWVRGLGVSACGVVGDQQADRTAGSRLWPSDHACVVADLEV